MGTVRGRGPLRVRRALHVVCAVSIVSAGVVAVATDGTARGSPEARVAVATRSRMPGTTSRPGPAAPVDSSPASTVPAPSVPATTVPAPSVPAATVPVAVAAAPVPVPAPAPAPAPEGPPLPTLSARIDVPALSVYDQPGAPMATGALLPVTELGTARVLPVVALGGDWLEVLLPTRPNGSTGWIRSRDVTLQPVGDAVVVDLAARTLAWVHRGVVVLSTKVGIGAGASPTPTGLFFVTDVFPADPAGSYGAWVIALDAHSDAFTEFEGGDARIAIHGTDDPASIGAAASAGCIRVAADPLRTLAAGLPPGTPVLVG